MLGAVIMNCRGLVDPQNKPFGNVLPLEVQVKIIFWVECFVMMDKRKKVNQEFKGLPKCDVTGFPQHLGEDRWWNQVAVRVHAPRKNGCHHCHRLFDHRFSVSESRSGIFFVWLIEQYSYTVFVILADGYDGGIGSSAPEPGQPHEQGDCVCHQPF